MKAKLNSRFKSSDDVNNKCVLLLVFQVFKRLAEGTRVSTADYYVFARVGEVVQSIEDEDLLPK